MKRVGYGDMKIGIPSGTSINQKADSYPGIQNQGIDFLQDTTSTVDLQQPYAHPNHDASGRLRNRPSVLPAV
jgi:hypothetical protein